MTQANGAALSGYYQNIQTNAHLLRAYQAETWSKAVLRTLGLNLDRGTKKELAKALPEELAFQLQRAFWLLHFRDKNKSTQDFLNEISRRGGNTDPEYARKPTMAVFHELKNLAGEDVSQDVADTLAPELSELWQKA